MSSRQIWTTSGEEAHPLHVSHINAVLQSMTIITIIRTKHPATIFTKSVTLHLNCLMRGTAFSTKFIFLTFMDALFIIGYFTLNTIIYITIPPFNRF